ncbi:MAG TPA: PHP domain-containing protein [Gemmatimonadales bacterium]|nr:PHP domain-containing protein [Gemmatimonadales bacterium]
MDSQSVSHTLDQLAAVLELRGESAAQVRAVQRSARSEILITGRSSALDELREQVPPGLVEMLRIPGLGVAKVRRIHDALAIESLGELEAAAADGRLAALPRFGPKTADNVRRGIASLRQATGARLFHHARDEIAPVRRALAGLGGVQRVEVAGAVRRRCEIIGQLDLVAVQSDPAAREALIHRLARAPGVTEIGGEAGTITLRFASGTVVDVLLTTPERFGFDWIRATGSTVHVAALEARARTMGVPLEGSFPDEARVYRALGCAWVPPELRDEGDALDAAAAGRLPHLVERSDLRGFLHCHSHYSDGAVTIPEWAAACRAAGYDWVGITDHSQSSAYAGGLRAEDVAQQHAEIDAVNSSAAGGGIRMLKGVEADILADGTLDYGPDVLDRFDFVIGSIHSRFGMSEGEMTRRVLTAMDDPRFTILGHPTGRLLLQREPYAIDLERVLRAAAERGIAVEVNADPHRLDLDWRLVRRARELGVTISIGADAHSTAGIANVDIGLGIVRKGWLEPAGVLNTRDAEEFLAFARHRRSVAA